jgi:hypothetical protein
MPSTFIKHKFYTTLLATGITFLINCSSYASDKDKGKEKEEESSNSDSTGQLCLSDFPEEILLQLFNELPDHDKVKNLPFVSSQCHRIQQDDQLWKSIAEKRFDASIIKACLQYSPIFQRLYNNGQAPQWREIVKNLKAIRNEIYSNGIWPLMYHGEGKGNSEVDLSHLIEWAIEFGSEDAKAAKIRALKLGGWGYLKNQTKAQELEKLWNMVPPSRYNK